MNEELTALKQNKAWKLVPRTSGMNVVGSRWFFKTKLKPNGSVERYNCCLIAKGYNHKKGIDFDETFSLVVKPTTIRIILTLAVVKNWAIQQLDVKNAFLHGFL